MKIHQVGTCLSCLARVIIPRQKRCSMCNDASFCKDMANLLVAYNVDFPSGINYVTSHVPPTFEEEGM